MDFKDWIKSRQYLDDEFEEIIELIDDKLVEIYENKSSLLNEKLGANLRVDIEGLLIDSRSSEYCIVYGYYDRLDVYKILKESPEELEDRISRTIEYNGRRKKEELEEIKSRYKKLKEELEQKEQEAYEQLKAKYG